MAQAISILSPIFDVEFCSHFKQRREDFVRKFIDGSVHVSVDRLGLIASDFRQIIICNV